MAVRTLLRHPGEICGDDSRILAMDAAGAEFLDLAGGGRRYIAAWQEISPWEIKVEGFCAFSGTETFEEKIYAFPPMVSRKYVMVEGVVFEPLYNISRLLKRLASSEVRPQDDEDALVQSAATTCALLISWQLSGLYFSPVVQYLMREYLDQYAGRGNPYENVHKRVAKIYAHLPRQRAPLIQPNRAGVGVVV